MDKRHLKSQNDKFISNYRFINNHFNIFLLFWHFSLLLFYSAVISQRSSIEGGVRKVMSPKFPILVSSLRTSTAEQTESPQFLPLISDKSYVFFCKNCLEPFTVLQRLWISSSLFFYFPGKRLILFVCQQF